ncbi:YbhB/YbcL family Raf kinase inhibitor-like protein [Sneathiella sp. P13V-1]|uniref:YbhB/YbcL family Raf kinase inhibitor-like protein n=1 Tax=Sneathiella sp. P13V-1 TaxID=2697366 RepID=UPI00187BC345|nr:YbhB/YbcL family Raf kinase inhibitor-like protein [Sneathiella sp. P13V-1]MBE7635219.1 YbhB/YbcL family Raf kinase inhibitor-like protein [Sneathiella sp. P13V-1]
MSASLSVSIEGWDNGKPIPGKYAFGVPAAEGHVALSDNLNPKISWNDAPEGTKSFAIICHDTDVPSAGDDVNQEGKTVPEDLPRVDFYHWVLVDIDADRSEIAEGEDSKGITAKGKAPGKQGHGVTGINNYTDWFAGDADMGGDYGGYDGPCPPWNDSIVHHYHFTVYALDVETLGLEGTFGGPEALAAMQGHILASGSYVGTYSLNPDVPA